MIRIGFFLIFVIIPIIIATDSVVKFKKDQNSLYYFSLKRNAYNPNKNTSEICSCDIELQQSSLYPSHLFANLTIIDQIFHKINRPASTEQEMRQLKAPFIIGLTEHGDVKSIVTEVDESYRSLEIKNQVVQTLLLNKTLYKSLIDGNENDLTIEVDLSKQLPMGLCNASVHIDRTDTEYKVRIFVSADMCWELVVGNVRLTNNSKYEVVTTFDKNGLTLKELKENTLIEIEITTDGRRAHSTYEFYLKFKDFVPKKNYNMDQITEEHNEKELDKIILY
uniref:CSON001248 protein n=1 Tax=Culicoides sonorensis TaxID=179676 RepID=A0A336MKK5_CULSO